MGGEVVAEAIERATIRMVAWRLLPLVFLLYLLSLIDGVNLGFAALTSRYARGRVRRGSRRLMPRSDPPGNRVARGWQGRLG
jgi:hypothetical protein